MSAAIIAGRIGLMSAKFYQCKTLKIGETQYAEVIKRARAAFRQIEKQTKRRPYLRSAYFNKEKIFFDYFWHHIDQKSRPERRRRLVFLPCALELIVKSRVKPESKINPNKQSELLHRFSGKSPSTESFSVQIKEDTKSGHKYLMSVFPG